MSVEFKNPYLREEHMMFREAVREFVDAEVRPNASKHDQTGNIDRSLLKKMADMGFMGMAIASQVGGINVWIGGVLGLLAAGAVHLYKMRSRPIVTTATNGMANPFLSIAEDMATVVGTAVAIFVPYAAVVVVPLLGWSLYRLTEKMKRGEFRIETLLGIKPPA